MTRTGLMSGIAAYFLWGLLPFYWKALEVIDPIVILCHRMIWSLIFLSIILIFRKEFKIFFGIFRKPKELLPYLISAILLSVNWFTYIWAVNNEYIVEASLGYFINPLIYVLLGIIILKERLRKFHVYAILLAFAGVFYLTVSQGRVPLVSLVLALSFGLYGYIKKIYPLDSLKGLSLETLIMSLPALFFILVFRTHNNGMNNNSNITVIILLLLSGVATSLPLLFFGRAAKNLSLTNLGLLQYIAPSIQFMIGLLVYKEAFPVSKLIGFLIVWTALIIYTIENLVYARRRKKVI